MRDGSTFLNGYMAFSSSAFASSSEISSFHSIWSGFHSTSLVSNTVPFSITDDGRVECISIRGRNPSQERVRKRERT